MGPHACVRRARRLALGLAAAGVLLASAAVSAAMSVEPAPAPPDERAASDSIPVGPSPRYLTPELLDAYGRMAGWPDEPGWWPEMRRIILCETASLDTMAYNPADPNGGSYGLAQLNGRYHFDRAGEDFRGAWAQDSLMSYTTLPLRSRRRRLPPLVRPGGQFADGALAAYGAGPIRRRRRLGELCRTPWDTLAPSRHWEVRCVHRDEPVQGHPRA